MSAPGSAGENLGGLFREPPAGAEAAGTCPAAERVAAAARGEASHVETGAILDHVAVCPACTVAWLVVRDLAAGAGVETRRSDARPSAWIGIAAAVAGIALATLAWLAPLPTPDGTAAFRSATQARIRPLTPEAVLVPRAHCVLRWESTRPEARYHVDVTDERLTPIAEASSLERPEFLVPESALAGVPPAGRILWQVEAVYPDGTRLVSETFAARVE